ncbi:MAG: tetratricopeptide repeat protein [Verrucomicrobiota bacterium]
MSSDPSEQPAQEPEEIESLSASEAASVVDSLDRNRNKIIGGVAAVAIGICAVLVYGQLKKQKAMEAAAAFTAAVNSGEIAQLDGVAVDFPGSIAAGNALISKAEILTDQGKVAESLATLTQFVAEYPDHPRLPQGLFAIANHHHIAGDSAAASSFYEQTITTQPDGELTPLARIRLGDLALESGDKEAAEQHYEESFTKHPGNPLFGYAEDKIALLKVGNPPVVPEPEPEPDPDPENTAESAEEENPKAAPKGGAKGNSSGKGKAKGKDKAKAAGKDKGASKEAPDETTEGDSTDGKPEPESGN